MNPTISRCSCGFILLFVNRLNVRSFQSQRAPGITSQSQNTNGYIIFVFWHDINSSIYRYQHRSYSSHTCEDHLACACSQNKRGRPSVACARGGAALSPGVCGAPGPGRRGREGWERRPAGSGSTERPAGRRAGSRPGWSAPPRSRGLPVAGEHREQITPVISNWIGPDKTQHSIPGSWFFLPTVWVWLISQPMQFSGWKKSYNSYSTRRYVFRDYIMISIA